ncbi:MAG: hypothetical protein PHI98_15070 [Eubacteriales bacterium]|nr:hypothetical protein [Eubacteriales bacterium]
MFDEAGRFVLQDYQHQPTFASFLPGIGGELGIPLWCYYVNRGQGVCSFGVNDKEHSIMEFSPAYTAYRDTARRGFRTFAKINGKTKELFCDAPDLAIGMSEREISGTVDGLKAQALYFGVPNERAAMLARVLTVTNENAVPMTLELLDGMPEIVPYGISQSSLKDMVNLAQAWMQSEDTQEGRAYFRVRASMEDSARVTRIAAGNFALSWDDEQHLLHPFVDQRSVFGTDTACAWPETFAAIGLAEMETRPQATQNRFPCCFAPLSVTLPPNGKASLHSLYGHAENKERVGLIAQKAGDPGWFEQKRVEARALIARLCTAVHTRTGNSTFDRYCEQTYLDNLLRGGVPMLFEANGVSKPFYLYSRKHGDPEREYNAFSLGNEYYAQGNGNFRDVNQNRRCDVLFQPKLGAENIHVFYDLIQIDGYNPLVLKAATYRLPAEKAEAYAQICPAAAALLRDEFTPGRLAMAAESAGMGDKLKFWVAEVICSAESQPNADFAEGYWCDHWTYNLDLIESYLAVWPEKKGALLFEEERYRWYQAQAEVNPRARRYERVEDGLRQYHALRLPENKPQGQWLRDENGREIHSSLMEKLLLLCAVKAATLDAAGMGVEMEGGKPGWYDALNGLPGLLGSSVAESCELARMLRFAADALVERGGQITVNAAILQLLTCVTEIFQQETDRFERWKRLNEEKEAFRAKPFSCLPSACKQTSADDVARMLFALEKEVRNGIEQATALCDGVCPTYFTFKAEQMVETDDGPMPTKLVPTPLPLFLEGPVRSLKLPMSAESKRRTAKKLRESPLYDRELRMYKVNASLTDVSYEAGRALAFTPGWLENESIWLHMEYKYLLELLKSELYDVFAEALHDAGVPFLDPKRYGRSPLENVSFIASSANPDPTVRGRGFVARLSGSTAEFLQIWQIMMIGAKPFFCENGTLCMTLVPFLPAYLMPADGRAEATLLGSVAVIYFAEGLHQLEPGQTRVSGYVLHEQSGGVRSVTGPILRGQDALDVREGRIASIEAKMEQQA